MTTLHDIPMIIRRAVRTGCNVHMAGNPGIGKTTMIEDTVALIQKTDPDFQLWLWYAPAMTPLDFTAIVPDTESKTLTAYVNTSMPNRHTDPDARGILFIGEMHNAGVETNKPLQKYINNEDLGGLQKPKGVVVVSDSNSLAHRSGVVTQSLALISRSRHVEVNCDPNEFLKYLDSVGASQYVQAYLSLRKDHVDTFAKVIEKRHYGVWANPRAWVRLSDALMDADAHNETLTIEEINGDIGESVGVEFVAFLKASKDLVSYEKVVKSPAKATMPKATSDCYAVMAMLAASTKAVDMAKVRTYVERFSLEIQVLYLRLLATSKGSHRQACVTSPAYVAWFTDNPELVAAINDDR